MFHKWNTFQGEQRMASSIDQRFFPLIFDSISHGIFTTNPEGIITSFNCMAEKLTGWNRSEVIGRTCWSIFQTDLCKKSCPLEYSISTGQTGKDHEVTILKKDGHRIPVAVSTNALLDDKGKIIGGVEMFRDLCMETELKKRLKKSYVFEDIVSKHHMMQKLFKMLPLVAKSQSTVLIEGESGTGKELIARAIHNLGPRKHGQFVTINCSAIPDTIMEAELFGCKKGAFAGAEQDRDGRLALAQGGTLLLDEIDELSKQIQIKLQRLIKQKEYEPVGSTQTVRADVRVIASSSRDLAQLVTKRRFRQDLYYCLNVVQIKLPPLAERREDVPLLVQHFIDRFNTLQSKRISTVSERVMSMLMWYPFPGNVRELENAVEHAFVVCTDTVIQVDDLPRHIVEYFSKSSGRMQSSTPPLENAEAETIRKVLMKNNFKRTMTARELGISRNTLWRKMKKYGIKA